MGLLSDITTYVLSVLLDCLLAAVILYITNTGFTKKQMMLFAAADAAALFAMSLITDYYPLIFLISIFTLFIQYRVSFREKIYKTLVFSQFHILLELFLESILRSVLGLTGVNPSSDRSILFYHLIAPLISATALLLLHRMKAGGKAVQQSGLMIVCVALIYFVLFPIMIFLTTDRYDRTQLVFYVLLNVVLLTLVSVYLYQSHRKILMEEKLKTEQMYMERLESELHSIMAFKHDIRSMLHMIQMLLEYKEYERLGDMLKGMAGELTVMENPSLLKRLKEVPELYGAILSRMLAAEGVCVKFNLKIFCPGLQLTYCTGLDLSRMVGVLLDNAIEAASTSSSQEASVDFILSENKGVYTIEVINDSDEVDVSRIAEHGFTSKEGHAGIGLTGVNGIIKKYTRRGFDMSLHTTFSEGKLHQVLTV